MAPSRIVWHFQECHSTLIHVICGAVEEMLAGSLDEWGVGRTENAKD